ncbi:methyltransferase domain-containing protein [Nocardia sp. NBC_00511]|uniref:methyltransferase domain-containing protein n=1 Tax=Nocardia sp. NBC_00511 TaxID=2903591 RepID=UPI0030DE9155
MSSGALRFDDATSARVESTYLTPDVVEQRQTIRKFLALSAGEVVLDVGSGPGFLVAEMAEAVGPAGAVHGLEPSAAMRTLAGWRVLSPDSAAVHFIPGDATDLPFADNTFDVVTATQTYEYVEDVVTALAEAHRVLRPGGRLLVLDTDWDSVVWHSSDRDRMRRVLRAWDGHLSDPHLPRRLAPLLHDTGFVVTDRRVVPLLNYGDNRDTYSAGLIEFVSDFVRGQLPDVEIDAWRADLLAMGTDYSFSLNRYLFSAVKPG